jgi:DNA-binding LacI/PurR family transcriptional regulator
MREARLKDVAALAGVSTATVSRVLHGNGYVSARARERVEAALRDSSYRLNAVAQELRRQKTITIGLILHGDLSNPFVGEIVIGAEQAAAEHGFTVLFLNAHGNPGQERECVETLLKRRVDGIIFTTAVHGKNVALALDAGVRAVEIERRLCAAASAVVVDNHAAATEAMRHLVSLGHREIGFLGEPFPHDSDNDATDIPKERFRAYRDVLKACGQVVDNSHIVVGHYPRERGGWGGLEAGAAYMRRLLRQAPGLTAVFAVSDLVAAGAMQALYAEGIRVPEQLSIIGFDDTFARYLAPPLTTIRQPMFDMGYKAASLAISLIAEDAPGSSVEFCQARLVIRETTAPARAAGRSRPAHGAGRTPH